jgi:hypothetical protein
MQQRWSMQIEDEVDNEDDEEIAEDEDEND